MHLTLSLQGIRIMAKTDFAESFLSVTLIQDHNEDDETTSGEGSSGGHTVDVNTNTSSLNNNPWFLYPAANR